MMKKCVNYMILPEFRIILECYKGQASVKDAIYMKKDQSNDNLYNPNYNIIVDFREFEAILDSTIKDSTTIFFNFSKKLYLKSKIAILTETPNQVVIGMILEKLSTKLETVKVAVFTTTEAAINFLGISYEYFDIMNNKISVLNKNTNE